MIGSRLGALLVTAVALILSTAVSATASPPTRGAGESRVDAQSAAQASPAWSAPVTFDAAHQGALNSVSCASVDVCYAIDGDSVVVGTDGRWSPPRRIIPKTTQYGLQSISCPAVGYCVAIGQNKGSPFQTYASVLRNNTWTYNRISSYSLGLVAVSCGAVDDCWAVAAGGILEHFDGTSWAESQLDSNVYGIASLSCSSASFCVAVDSEGGIITYQADAWGPTKFPLAAKIRLYSVSCVTGNFCMTTSLDNQTYSFQGGKWRSVTSATSPSGSAPVVDCTSPQSCSAVDTDGGSWSWSASQWHTHPPLPGGGVSSISCASTKSCTAVGLKVWTSTPSTWSAGKTVDYTQGSPNAVSCPEVDTCFGTDSSAATFGMNSTGWRRLADDITADSRRSLLSCPATTFCVAAEGTYDGVETFDGTSWSSPSSATGEYETLDALTCASTTFCMAINSADDYATYDGSDWTAPRHISGNTGEFTSASCPVAGWCAAVSSTGQGFSFANGQWHDTKAANSRLLSVSCASSLFCLAVGDARAGAYFLKGSWHPATLPAAATDTESVSCPRYSRDCMAVDFHGAAFFYNGAGWDTGTAVDRDLVAVSCAADSRCVAVTSAGDSVSTMG